MWALAKLKDFRIAPCIRNIDMPKLLTLGMNNPVCANIKRTSNSGSVKT